MSIIHAPQSPPGVSASCGYLSYQSNISLSCTGVFFPVLPRLAHLGLSLLGRRCLVRILLLLVIEIRFIILKVAETDGVLLLGLN